VVAMVAKLNALLLELSVGFTLDIDHIVKELTQGMIRERHVAKSLRLKVYEFCNNDEAAITALMGRIFVDKALKSDVENHAAVENEIRGNLLKAGGHAFVPEDPKAFLPMQ